VDASSETEVLCGTMASKCNNCSKTRAQPQSRIASAEFDHIPIQIQHCSAFDITAPDGHGATIASEMPAKRSLAVESEPKVVFKMIAEPLLLTWEQLLAMPAMRKRAGRGGKAACLKQRELRAFCLSRPRRDEVDLARSAYNWRLLLKTTPCLNTPDVIGPGIVGFSFRLLSEIDPNYAAERHVFELTCANGDRWHLHFHQRGNCDRRHLPWSRDNAEPASASERRLAADGAQVLDRSRGTALVIDRL